MLGLATALIAAYLIGAIPTGVLLTRLAGVGDVRQSGSGNIGATNVYRVAGRRLGILTLVGDALKGVIPVLYAAAVLRYPDLQLGLVALAAFLGHCYPVYLGFKGGKGVATALGIYLVLSPLAVLGAFALFAAILWQWRYVSLASICAAGAIPFLVLAVNRSLPLFLATMAISALVIFRHRANIERLKNGTESRFKA
ncbi:glycerol-3-phosphate acyltransferase [Desulfuromonas versatilis]|uniref:Glycerol-3-phosphate acyltransferase n=1 Tax=Desulfuromonas versatilis TaxID=2802975 RepID=A0ABN6DVI6_9BACT|nr:glycerol-3-phosphate 1-O-acyltransferase PlsY [Desulfuromonas versatilis]BCR03534.1 glycerol-3-phosphate acyltransferase [Desulfuromonas versatilis]